MIRSLLVVLCLCWSWSVGAVGDRSAASASGHSWFVAPHPVSGELVLHHLPPGSRSSRQGQVTVVRLLGDVPVSMAALGDEVFLALPDDEPGEVRVYSLRAASGPGGSWLYVPDGRLRRLPALPGAGSRGAFRLEAVGEELHAVAGDRALRLADAEWLATDRLEIPPGSFRWGRDRFRVGHADDVWRVFRIEEANERLIASIEEVPGSAVPVLRAEDGRLALLWHDEPEDRPQVGRPPPPKWHLVEISLSTGRELYRGGAGPALPVNAQDFRALAFALFVFMSMVLVGSLGPKAADHAMVLPEGVALADPGRRLVAWVIDALPGFILAWGLLGLGSDGAGLFHQAAAVMVALLVGHAHSAVSESITGRSVGKLLVGCRVVSVAPEDAGKTPGLGRALVRNLGRWALAPIGVTGVMGVERRHIGDLWTRSAVVIKIGDPGDPDPGGPRDVEKGSNAQE